MKFKNIKKKKAQVVEPKKKEAKKVKVAKVTSKKESPKNNRIITEQPQKAPRAKLILPSKPKLKKEVRKRPWGVYLAIVLTSIGIIWVGLGLGRYIEAKQKLTVQQEAIKSNLEKWEGIIASHPGYRDAYMEAAVFAYEVKDMKKAEKYVDAALQLDPNFEPALRLKGILITEKR